MTPSIIHLAYQNTRLGFIEGGGNVEALMAVRTTAGEPAEMNLARPDRPFDAVEDAFIPPRTVDVQFIGENIELVSGDLDPATHTKRDLCGRIENSDGEGQSESKLFVVPGSVARPGNHGHTIRGRTAADLDV